MPNVVLTNHPRSLSCPMAGFPSIREPGKKKYGTQMIGIRPNDRYAFCITMSPLSIMTSFSAVMEE
ncbi:MAG: hypothetical protein LKE39_04325 [Sphaerochaeta sp.]|jgi:hypothetical protein|nr:hypothetical protein [Sphaerochaeta sp.]